jgi:hypothetical protein
MKTVEVHSVTYFENRTRTFEVECPNCYELHGHSWPLKENVIGLRQGACGELYDVKVPRWANNSRYRFGYAKLAPTEHALISPDVLDDNAIDDPANNWEE